MFYDYEFVVLCCALKCAWKCVVCVVVLLTIGDVIFLYCILHHHNITHS